MREKSSLGDRAFERGLRDRLEGRKLNLAQYRRESLRNEYMRGWNSDQLFDLIHEEGAARHETTWLLANEQAVRAFRQQGMPPEKEPLRSAVSLAVLRILDACLPGVLARREAMSEATLAHQLRQRQYALGEATVAEIDALSDAELIDCYITCPGCQARQVTDRQLRLAIQRADDADSFLWLVHCFSHRHGSLQ